MTIGQAHQSHQVTKSRTNVQNISCDKLSTALRGLNQELIEHEPVHDQQCPQVLNPELKYRDELGQAQQSPHVTKTKI